MKKTIKDKGGYELGKRTYLDISFNWKCPNCEKENTQDFNQDYLAHPVSSAEEIQELYCWGCDWEGYYKTKLTISLDIDCDYLVI